MLIRDSPWCYFHLGIIAHHALFKLQRKTLVSDPGMHHGTCVTHVPWCMSGSLTRGSGENVPGILGACATRNFAYLARGPWKTMQIHVLIDWFFISGFQRSMAYQAGLLKVINMTTYMCVCECVCSSVSALNFASDQVASRETDKAAASQLIIWR